MDRNQGRLFSTSLDSTIPPDHPVRLFDEILSKLDWATWEARYPHTVGRPPIPPQVMAAVILYGMSVGIRSSRRLEEACLMRLDFIWLARGRDIDHSTLCAFRKAFGKELKDTFRQIGRVAIQLGLMRLNRIGLDGTRERANSSRHATATAKTLAERLAVLDEQIEAAFTAAEAEDRQDQDLLGDSTPNKLPPELAELKRRQERLQKALDKARALDAKRGVQAEGAGPAESEGNEPKQADAQGEAQAQAEGQEKDKKKPRPTKVPVADPDAAVMPNKEGGYAPNYTPLAAVDDERGYIADADVDDRPTEGQATVATVDRIEERFGKKPQEVVADGAYADGQELAGLEARGVQAYVPVTTAQGDGRDNPAVRPDPTQPVPPEAWDRLPRSKKGKRRQTLDRSAFIYDEPNDCFYCPMGRKLERKDSQDRSRADGDVVRVYRYECQGCQGCPLGAICREGHSARCVQVDEYEPVRRRVAAATKSTAGQEAYRRRSWLCETPFAFIKAWMNCRQFLLRGLEKVKIEWLWTCTAYNLRKLVADVQRIRVKFAAMLV
jgi:transposase